MIMYGVYNSDTLKDLIDMVHRMQNFTTWHEKTFAGKLHDRMETYSQDEGTKSNKDYDLILTRLYPYYDMKLVTFGIDNQRNLIVKFPVFIQPYTQKRLIMYQIETVPVPILDKNEQAYSYTELKIEKLYIALNEETYITLHTQELKMCKKIGYKYYCKELFVIKKKTRYSCANTIYFNLESDVIRANCEFQYYYNKTDIKPTVLDGGFQIILANSPNYRKIMCSHNNNIPINIPGHPYVLMN